MHLLVSSYLNGKKQLVSFGGYESTCEKIEVGVPQGSVLGPLLFLVHINDLQINTNLNVLNFTDDIMFYKTFTKDTHLNDSNYFSTELRKFSDWLMVNKLKLNLGKTRSMLVHHNLKTSKTIIKNCYKYMGKIKEKKLN